MANQLRTALTILRRGQVEAESGYSRSTLYLRIAQGLWTKQVSLGARAVGWPAAEVDALNAARIAGQGDAEIRVLVTKLLAARKSAK
jgi:prophage regulatory protein